MKRLPLRRSGQERPSPPRLVFVGAVVVLMIIATLTGHNVGSRGTKVQHIDVITPNTSCSGLKAGAVSSSTGGNAGHSTQQHAPDASLLKHVLPLTNFSSLSSAAILQSAADAKLPVPQLQPLMQLHQQLWCSSQASQEPLPSMTTVRYSNVSIYLYNSNDIVSNELRGRSKAWETYEIKQMLWALNQYEKQAVLKQRLGPRPQQRILPAAASAAAAAAAVVAANTTAMPAAAAATTAGRRRLQHQQQQQQAGQPRRPPLMVDVGSNVGWFAINGAARGARVAAFEAMDANLALIRRSLCANPWLAQRVALFGTGLGERTGTCSIVSADDNKGDGIAVCGKTFEQAAKEMNWSTTQYKVRGEMSVRRLDELLQEDVQVMKMDVEGFELKVLRGAERLFTQHNVWYLMLECNGGLVGGRRGQMEYLRFLDSLGYVISLKGFSGPYLDPEAIREDTVTVDNMNLYCVRKDLHQAVQAAPAAAGSTATAATAAIGGK